MKKRILSMILAIVMLITMIPSFTISSFAATSGECGDNIIWTFDVSTGTLTISGTGEMKHWMFSPDYFERPWEEFKDEITKIIIDDGVQNIASNCFWQNQAVTSVEIANSVKIIGSCAFEKFTSIENIIIPNSVEIIEEYAFARCKSLKTITIGTSVTEIQRGAFHDCVSLEEIYYNSCKNNWEKISVFNDSHQYNNDYFLSANLNTLEHEFEDEYTIDIEPTCYADGSKSRHCTRCDSKTDITEVLATNHIDKCYCYEYEVVSETDKTIKITKYLGKEAKVEIPTIIDGYTVVAIGESAFAENSTIISVEIPDTVKTIGKNAFFLCYNLAKVVLPEGLTTIEYSAFSYCTGLINIRIPDSVTEIGESAFSYCSSLETINIPSEITYIRKNTFRACDKLTRVIVPEKVEIIDEYAFAYCSSLIDIWLPISIDIICENAFSYSNGFSTVYYAGTETEWNNITIGDKKLLNSAQIHYNVSVEELDSHWQEYSIASTCTEDGECGYSCPCGYKISSATPTLGHNYVDNICTNCGDSKVKLNGWVAENGRWAYYEDGVKVTNRWLQDSVGWCYVGYDGYCITNTWAKDSFGWCYLDANGRMVCNNWVLDGGKWYFMDANGYMVSNCWKKDSKGWCYLGSSGAMLTNAWVRDSVGWCYVGANGYCVTNKWVKDSKGWCYLDNNGRMVYNKWVKDSVGWCYVGSSGYMVYNQWVKDSKGWCYVSSNGYMVYDKWIQDGCKWYYIDANGYMVTGTKTINGKTYKFNSNGVWIS